MTDDCQAACRMTNTFCWLRVSSRSGNVLWNEVWRGAQTDLALLILLPNWVLLELLMGAATLGSPQSQERWLKTCTYLHLSFFFFVYLKRIDSACMGRGSGGDRAWHNACHGLKEIRGLFSRAVLLFDWGGLSCSHRAPCISVVCWSACLWLTLLFLLHVLRLIVLSILNYFYSVILSLSPSLFPSLTTLCVCMPVGHTHTVEARITVRSLLSPPPLSASPTWVLGTKIRSPSLGASTFTLRACMHPHPAS